MSNTDPNNKNFDPLAPSTPEEEAQAAQDAQDDHALEEIEEPDEFEALELELEKTKDHLLRALADAENTRRRAVKDREDAGKYAISSFARDLLTVADNLRRALDAIPAELIAEHDQVKNLIDGIEATERELLKTFEKNGVKQIDPMDEPFNPNFHEVMFEAPHTGKPAGTIMQVMEKGYVLKDRLLRPARVGVAKDDGNNSTPEESIDQTPGAQIDTEA